MDSQSLAVYDFLLDELIVDVAQACHRQAKTGAHAAELGPGQGTAGGWHPPLHQRAHAVPMLTPPIRNQPHMHDLPLHVLFSPGALQLHATWRSPIVRVKADSPGQAPMLVPFAHCTGQTAGPPRLQPLPPGPGVRGPVDVFGQSHPAKSTDVVTCKNCGRQVQAGTFAPHLEKCMGKGRAAARAASRRIQGQV